MIPKILKCKLLNKHDDVRTLGVDARTFVPELGQCRICDEMVKARTVEPKWKRMNLTKGWNL